MTMLLTIGHSSVEQHQFIDVVLGAGIEEIVDVRTVPASGYSPQFNQQPLRQALTAAGVKYTFMGAELGGRPDGAAYYDDDGKVLYYRVAASPSFLEGLSSLERLASDQSVAVMCSEEDPAGCHRHLLIARVLFTQGVTMSHVRHDGQVAPYRDMPGAIDQTQEALFDLGEDLKWKSIRSVSPKSQPGTSSGH